MGLSSWIWTFGSALPSGKMAKFSLGKVTVKFKIEEIMQREFHKVMQIVTYVDTLLNVTVNFYLF